MSVAAWDGFLNDQSNWPAASRIGNATGATTARDTLGDKTFVKRKRMSQEERHLQILQAAVKIIATKGFWGMSLQNISDELGITEELRARQVQAALASAAAFTVGALLPIATTVLAPAGKVAMVTTAATLVGLLLSGGLAARVGGAPVLRGAWRVGFWGAMAMGAAALVGRLFHVSI